jgi:hypothetical protein
MSRSLRAVRTVVLALAVSALILCLAAFFDLPIVSIAGGAARAAQAGAPAAPCTPAGAVRFICGQRAPEDLVALPGSRWVVASAYSGAGGLFLIRASDRVATQVYPALGAAARPDTKTDPSCPGAPAPGAPFQTHGLSLQQGRNSVHRLYAVMHSGRESVEVFEIDARPATPTFTWIGCAVAPEPVGLNSVRGLPDGGFIATNFLARGIDADGRNRMMAGEKNGELWEWHTASGWQKVPGSEASGANGLEMSEDGRTLYVASWGGMGSFFRLSRGQGAPKRDEIPLGFRVDNIRWARDGSILAAGQAGPPGASVIVAIDPKTLRVREVLRRPDDAAFRSGTVAVEIGSDYWVGSYMGDRIAVIPRPK